ncbi:Peptidase family S41 [Oribacterium sp. KHPX15]|uniref:S41 family peptidase n=1 Tax=Oribacterium sp. KHPX15 TaxID=1855342 RepID=UPI00089A751F|nr:S41 family peptidase [Oribacterium sp. KHPX15]SEA46046.1 Peptidase family S41 [Oribacterium sp. KHPX15]
MRKRIAAVAVAGLMVMNISACQTPNTSVNTNGSAEATVGAAEGASTVAENETVEAAQGKSTEESESQEQEAVEAAGIEKKTLPLYVTSADNKQEIDLYFVDGSVIPYVSVADISSLLQQVYESDNPAEPFYELKYETDGNQAGYARGAYKLDFDFENDTIEFNDYDAFFKMDNSLLVDMVCLTANTAKLFQQSSLSTDRYGKVVTFDLKPYGIKLIRDKDGYYAPLQTVSDVIFSYYENMALYNGDSVIIAAYMDDDLKKIFNSGSEKWSEELAEFSYNEICFALDYQYGLKEIHDIESFDKLLSETGLKSEFLSSDETVAEAALYKLIYLYLGDLHSQFNGISYMTDRDKLTGMVSPIGMGLAGTAWGNDRDELSTARDKHYPEGIPAYEEIWNTAYITFDHFTDRKPEIDYFAEPTDEDNSDADTIRLMQYACQQILRENSPVENVVMDLSINGGGDTCTAEYVMATFLGQADLSAKNTLSGAMTDAVYTIDTNLDGEFDEKDTLAGKGLHLFCLESPVSFSCGNLAPNAFKASHKVTLLGQESGGGSCSVHCFSTAGGSQYQVSGFRRFSIMKNGSFYDVDRGAQPDYFIGEFDRFYDRKNLTEYINSLY